MKNPKINTSVVVLTLAISSIVTFGEAVIKGVMSLLIGKISPLRQTRLLRIWHWVVYDGPRQFWQKPSIYRAIRSPATLVEVILGNKK